MRRGSQPAWLITLVGVALVLPGWYLWQGVQNYLRSGDPGVREVTGQARLFAGPTVIRQWTRRVEFAPPPTRTPMPECQPFVVVVPEAIVRAAPAADARIVRGLFERDDLNDDSNSVDPDPDTAPFER